MEPTKTDAMTMKGCSHVGNEGDAEDGVFVLEAEPAVELAPVVREVVAGLVEVRVGEVEDATTLVPDIWKPLPMVDALVHWEEGGAVWADGVAGSPWWKVDEP
jgi:hypothetical protein